MNQIIEQFIIAFHNLDNVSLSYLHPEFKGIRTIDEQLLFDIDHVQRYFESGTSTEIKIKDINEKKCFYYVDAVLNNKEITMKISHKDQLIYQVYIAYKLVDKKRIMCVLQYDGSMYYGYQKQPNNITVQSTIENAIFKVLQEEITIHSSGRTDKGVHALNQVIHFDTATNIPGSSLYKLINKLLPDSIQLKSSENVHETFHSRYDIQSKEYLYVLNIKEYDITKRNLEWFVEHLNVENFKRELRTLIGTHDFRSFTKTTDKDTIRTIYDIQFIEGDSHVNIYIKGNGFLRYMVRNIIAYAVNVAQNKTDYTLLEIASLRDNSVIKDIAPAGGLYMYEVKYSE